LLARLIGKRRASKVSKALGCPRITGEHRHGAHECSEIA
jgi:hypothetical protein